MLSRLAAVAVALASAAVACGDADGAPVTLASSTTTAATSVAPATIATDPPATVGETSTTTAVTTTTGAAPTSALAPVAAARPCEQGEETVQLTGGRSFRVLRPRTDLVLPVVMVLHGYTGSPEAIEATSGWTEAVVGDAVVVYPRGIEVAGREGYGWAAGTDRFSVEGPDDVAYLWQVYEAVLREHCGDDRRVLLTGESNGAAMAVRAACADAFDGAVTMIAAVIPAVDEGAIAGCAGLVTPLLVVASQRDRVVPFAPDARADDDPMGQLAWFSDAAVAGNGCSDVRAEEGGVVHNVWVGVGCLAPSVLVSVLDGDGHTWPGGPEGTGGLDPGSFDATGLIWGLFTGVGPGDADASGAIAAGWSSAA